jgi:Methyltransferase domain
MGLQERRGLGRLSLELAAASCAVLLQELALIRWLPGQVRVLAYFPNLVLLGAFLGLGLGCLRAGRRDLLPAWPVLLLVVTGAAAAMSRVAFTSESASEHLFLLYYDLPSGSPVVNGVALPIVVCFVLGALSFVPLGQFVASQLDSFRERSLALAGYTWDIAGSLLGVLAFSAVSFAGAFPAAWFALLLALGLVLVRGPAWRRAAYILVGAAVLLVVARSERGELYSPYYAISLRQDPGRGSFAVLTNGSLHQYALPVGPSAYAEHEHTREGYHLPYRRLSRPPRRALVVGAGTGNDVAVLLAEGAERVDAVEIDPVILALGERHPDRPYASPRVTAINADARSFLNRTDRSYDLIVFGTLDSMTRLSALSNVRLDNFVYTVDCLRAARERLTPDGGLVLYYMVSTPYIDLRLQGMVTKVFGETPLVEAQNYGLFNRILMAGPAFEARGGSQRQADAPAALRLTEARVELPSDDWPYLYLGRRGLSGFYLTLMAAFAALGALGVAAASPEMRRSFRELRGADWEMFLFGLAFLLLETRSVTEMNLAWGGTWLTSAVVFGSILAVVLAATLLGQVRPLGYASAMAGLALSLLAAYAVPAGTLARAGVGAKLLLSALFVGAPIFFAASAFAILFQDRQSSSTAFGWNLLGAVAGGLLEFASMVVGLKTLLLVALAAYLGALLVRRRSRKIPVPEGAST